MKYTPARSFAAKSIAAGVAAVTFASAGVALAASGNLPSDGQEDRWGNGWGFGLQKDEAEEIEPVEAETPEEEVTDEEVTDEDVVEEEITDETPAAFNGHCRAFSVGNKDTNGKALEAPPFVALIEAAGGVENVEAYCTALFADETETDTDSGDDEAKKAKKEQRAKKAKKDRSEHPGGGNGSGPGAGGGSDDDGSDDDGSDDESGDEGSETDTP